MYRSVKLVGHARSRPDLIVRLGSKLTPNQARLSSQTSSTTQTHAPPPEQKETNGTTKDKMTTAPVEKTEKTQAQLDAELQAKLAALAGDGGEAGVEYEDGKPVAMKRSVQQNMFRYI